MGDIYIYIKMVNYLYYSLDYTPHKYIIAGNELSDTWG